jgi:hypothetical protein
MHMHRNKFLQNLRRWRLVPGTTCYFVSDDGLVASCVNRNFKVLTPCPTQESYLQVALRQGRKLYVHQLVMHAFVGPPPSSISDPVVDHLDFDRLNNDLSNLRWYPRVLNMRRTPATAHLLP